MRRFLWIVLLSLLTLPASWAQTRITVEDVNFEVYELSEANPDGVKITTNPVDHSLIFTLERKEAGVYNTYYKADARAAFSVNYDYLDLKGHEYVIPPHGIDAGKFRFRWRCRFFEANSDNQKAYQMERAEIFYEADGGPRTLLQDLRVENSYFNTYTAGNSGDINLSQPSGVKQKIKFLVKCYLREREAVTVSKQGLESFSPGYFYDSGTPETTPKPGGGAEGKYKMVRGNLKLWKNTMFFLEIDKTKPFNLAPKDSKGNFYTKILKQDEGSITRYGWFITDPIHEWATEPENCTLKITRNDIIPYSLTNNEFRKEGGSYHLPKGTQLTFRVKLASTCNKVSRFIVEKEAGGEEVVGSVEEFLGVYYENVSFLYTIKENIKDVRIEEVTKVYRLNYATTIGDRTVSLVEMASAANDAQELGTIPSGAMKNCNTYVRVKISGGTKPIESLSYVSEQFPAGRVLNEISPGSGIYKTFVLFGDVSEIRISFAPLLHKVKYNSNSSGCGTLTVKDDKGNPLTAGIVHNQSWEYLTLEASALASGKYFKHFKITYEDGTTVNLKHNPAYPFDPSNPSYLVRLPLEKNIDNIEFECGDLCSLKFTGANYTVKLESGSYLKDGKLLEEVGHLFAPNSTHFLSMGSQLRLGLSSTHNLLPMTKLQLTFGDNTTQEYPLSPSVREVVHTLAKGIKEIKLLEPTNILTVHHDAQNGKPRLKLKTGQAFDKTTHLTVAVGNFLPADALVVNGATLELDVTGVTPSAEDKMIVKYVVKMTSGDKEFLPTATDKSFTVTGNVTEVKVEEQNDPAIAGPFTIDWNENSAVYSLSVTYLDGTPVTKNTTQIPKNTELKVTLTLQDPLAGIVQKVVPRLDNGVTLEPLTPTVNGAEYTYSYTIKRKTTLQIEAQNRQTWMVSYQKPADRNVFVGTSTTEVLPTGTKVLDNTKIYIRITNEAVDAADYTLHEVKVNGIPISEKEGDFYTYTVTENVTTIEAVFVSRPRFTVIYEPDQPNVKLSVTKRVGGTEVPSGSSYIEGTELLVKPKIISGASTDPILAVKKVVVQYDDNTAQELLKNGDSYIIQLTKNITAIVVETRVASKYKVTFGTKKDKNIVYTVTNSTTGQILVSGDEVDAGTKLQIQVIRQKPFSIQLAELFIIRNNPNYTEGSSEPKFLYKSIINQVESNGGDPYYWYVVDDDITIRADFDEQELPSLSFRFANKPGDYTLEVRAGSAKGKQLNEGEIYNYPSGTRFYIKVIIDPSKPTYRVSYTSVNEVETHLEKEGEWYVVELDRDITSVTFELKAISSNMSLLTYQDPVNAKLQIYNQGVLVPSGTMLPQGTDLFAVVSEQGDASFSMITINGIVHLPAFLSSQNGKEGMAFQTTHELETKVVAYVATPLPENVKRYHITVEKPLYGTLRLRRLPDLQEDINSGETKEALVGDQFELDAHYSDKEYELVSNSIAQYITKDPSRNTPIFTVPTLPDGEYHIRVVLVYAPLRPTFEIFWSQNAGGKVSAVNTSDGDTEVILGSKVPQGDFIRYKLQAEKGYRIAQCVVNGEVLPTGNLANYEAVFRMESYLQILASFEPDPNYQEEDPSTPVEDIPTLRGVRITPNPFTTQLYIRGENGAGLRYELINAQGRLLRAGLLDNETLLHTDDLPAGLYLLRILTPQGEGRTFRMVK